MEKTIAYTISGVLYFEADDNIDIEEYLDKIKEIGSGKIDNVEFIDTVNVESHMNDFHKGE